VNEQAVNEQQGSGSELEAALSRLDEIVASLEREDLELESALKLFEEGVGQLRAIQNLLQSAELRIEKLIEEASGPRIIPMEET